MNGHELTRWDLPYRYGSRLFVPTASLHVAAPAVLFFALGLVDAFILVPYAVERRRKARGRAFEELERSPGLSVLHASFWPEEVRPFVELQPQGRLDDLVELHKGILREGIERHWRQLRAMEVVVGEAEEAFGEDPCVPDVRHKIDHTRERLADLHGEAQAYLGPFELPEPDEDEVAEVRAVAERAG